MLARDLSSPLPLPYQSHQDGVPDAQSESLNDDSRDEIPTYKDSSRPDQDVIVRAIILYFPIMPLMQVQSFTIEVSCLLNTTYTFCSFSSSLPG